MPDYVISDQMIYAVPDAPLEDQRAGGFCPETGMWWPASQMVMTSQGRRCMLVAGGGEVPDFNGRNSSAGY